LVPFIIVRLTRGLDEHVEVKVPLAVDVPSSLLASVVLTGIAYAAGLGLPLSGALLPKSTFATGLAVVLIGFFFMITRLTNLCVRV